MVCRPLNAVLAACAVLCTSLAFAVEPPAPAAAASEIALPAAKTDGAMSLEKAMHQRRSIRSLAPAPLTLAELAQLCWAAQGVTDAKGHRTAPSSWATYPLELYVIAGNVEGLPPGIYRYLPAKHALTLLVPGDRRAEFDKAAVGQGWIAKAPVMLVLTGTVARAAARGKERALPFVWVEAGLAAENVLLQVTALGFGSTYVGGFRPAEARTALGLPEGEEVMAVLPIGRRP